MKRPKISLLIVLGAIAVLTITGCQKKPKGITPIPATVAQVDDASDDFPSVAPPPDDGRGFNNNLDGGVPIQYGDDPGWTALGPTDDSIPLPEDPDSMYDGMIKDEDYFAANTVYFGFDMSAIEPDEAVKIDEVADYLKSNPGFKVLIEGHCDERGTEGYNLALGERRALTIREYLVNSGVSPNRASTISYGEARPADPGATEEAYDLNRRGVFVRLSPME